MNGVRLGFWLARERVRGVTPWLTLAWIAAALSAFAVIERVKNDGSAVDNVLEAAVFGLALPIVAYLVSERVCDGERLDRSVDLLARHGADRRSAMLGVLAASALCAAISGAALTLLAGLTVHDTIADLATAVPIALVAGGVYALWFGAAAQLGKHGGGRKWALILDFTFGTGSSVFALPFPRGHARNLLGGEPVLEFPQWAAWLALLVIASLSVTRGVVRSPR